METPAKRTTTSLQSIWSLLRITFTVVPMVAGLDKFLNILTHWEGYLNPGLAGMLPFGPSAFMGVVGIIEMAAGALVFTRTRLGAQVVAAWLVVIALSLIVSGSYLDVAVRDLVMAVGALTLANLTPHVESGN